VSGTPTAAGAFSYTIKVTDSGSPAQTATQVISGAIAPAALTLASTASATTQVGQSYSQTNVASGGTAPYTYAVFAGELPPGATLSASTGTVSGTPTAAGVFSYAIKATDSGSPAQTATQVTSGAIAPASLTLAATASATTQVGQSYSQTNVAGGGTTPYTYSLSSGALPAGASLNSATGTVSGTPTAAGPFSYAIKATDSGSPQQTATAASSGTMTPATLTVTATPSATTQVGQSYSQTNVAGGGTTPYAFSLAAGALPAGASLNSATGAVSGTPTAAGAFSYAIKATDSGSPQQTATAASSGTIAPATLTLTATPSATTEAGQSYSQANVAGGGTAPYTYSLAAGALPAGTSLNSSTGAVSGTPTTAGAFSYAIKATDSGGPQQTATAASSGTITPANLTVTATPSATTQVGQSYSQANVAGGGAAPYTYALAAGALPAGTSLNSPTGTVSGTPTTVGAFSYAIKATDSGNPQQTATASTSGTIAPAPLTLTATPSATKQVGQSYSQTNVASGGTTPFTYSVSGGALPAGTSLNGSTGTVSGTPTATSAFSYVIKATDSGAPQQTATASSSGSITAAATTTALTAAPNPSAPGETVIFTANVTSNAGSPTGKVTFEDGAATLGSSTLASGVATFSTSALSAGAHSITAAFGGAGAFAPSTSSAVTQTVNAPVYQGTAFVNGVTSACATNGIAVGDYYTIIYRQLAESGSAYGGGVQFDDGRSAVSYVMPANEALNSGTQNQPSVTAYVQSSEADPTSYTAGFDLKISSPGTAKKPAADVTITGTVANFFNDTGCTVTIGAALELRP
jgi:hypothetical protein